MIRNFFSNDIVQLVLLYIISELTGISYPKMLMLYIAGVMLMEEKEFYSRYKVKLEKGDKQKKYLFVRFFRDIIFLVLSYKIFTFFMDRYENKFITIVCVVIYNCLISIYEHYFELIESDKE